MKNITLLLFLLSLSLCSCGGIEETMIRHCYSDQDSQYYAARCDTCKSMVAWLPSDAVLTAIQFYKKNFRKSVLTPNNNHFEVSLLNDSVWRVESFLIYKRLSSPTIKKYGYSNTGVLLISRKDATVLYFSIYQLSSIKETHSQEISRVLNNSFSE